MGLLAKLKNIFGKNIDCSKALDDVFFHLMPWVKVTIDSNLIVKDGFVALFVCKNKVTDILPAGKHKLNNNTIPYTFKKLKLYKIDKYGHMPTKFNCDIYFVSTGKIKDFEFVSNNPYIKKSNRFGKIVAYSEGVCDVTISEPQKLLEYMLLERAYVKDKTAISEISCIIGNAVNEILEKSSDSFGELVADVKNTNNIIDENIEKILEFCGLKCDKFDLRYMHVNSKLQQKLDEYLKMQREYNAQFAGRTDDILSQTLSAVMVEREGETEEDAQQKQVVYENPNPIDITKLNKKQCGYCGKYISEKARYCEFCGFEQNTLN